MNKRLIVGAGFLVLAAATGTAPAVAGWGCGSNAFPGGHFRVWGADSEQEARAATLRLCRTQFKTGCRIASCRPDIDSEEQADALWPLTTNDRVKCGTEGAPDC